MVTRTAVAVFTPQSYAGAFIALAAAGVLDGELAQRMALAAGFRNRIVRAYEGLECTTR
jgi:uncharacterized protein YutE (UPF0331/DUF86 family)